MDKIIVVVYLNIPRNYNQKQIGEFINKTLEKFNDPNIKHYIIPVYDENTRIECLNPKLINEEDYVVVQKQLDIIEKKFKDIVNIELNQDFEKLKKLKNEIISEKNK